MPISITFLASTIEIITIYGMMLLLDSNNRMEINKIVIYVVTSVVISTLLDHFHISYHFIYLSFSNIILLKVLLKKKKSVLLLMDVIIASGSYLFLQFISSIVIGIFHGNILETSYIQFFMLFLFAGITWLLVMNEKVSSYAERLYANNRDIAAWVAINLCFTIVIVPHIWNDTEHFFWKEQWELLILVIANYSSNVVLLISFLRRKQQKNKMRAYQEYGQYLEEMMHQLSSRQHEFVNQINVMMGLAQTKKKEDLASAIIKYGERILDEKKRAEKSIVHDDSMVAAMLYQKKTQAEKEQIQFEYLIEEPFLQSSISAYDLVELGVNLINNAFEAVSALPTEERQVFLKLNKNRMEVTNTVSKDFDHTSIVKFSQIGYSTKGTRRGYGVSNIKTIVNRYQGQLDIYMQNQMIVFSILFP